MCIGFVNTVNIMNSFLARHSPFTFLHFRKQQQEETESHTNEQVTLSVTLRICWLFCGLVGGNCLKIEIRWHLYMFGKICGKNVTLLPPSLGQPLFYVIPFVVKIVCLRHFETWALWWAMAYILQPAFSLWLWSLLCWHLCINLIYWPLHPIAL